MLDQKSVRRVATPIKYAENDVQGAEKQIIQTGQNQDDMLVNVGLMKINVCKLRAKMCILANPCFRRGGRVFTRPWVVMTPNPICLSDKQLFEQTAPPHGGKPTG